MIGTKINSAWPIASATFRAYCECGSAIHTTIKNPGQIEVIMDAFAEVHQGEGHGPCDAKTALKARRKRERSRALSDL